MLPTLELKAGSKVSKFCKQTLIGSLFSSEGLVLFPQLPVNVSSPIYNKLRDFVKEINRVH